MGDLLHMDRMARWGELVEISLDNLSNSLLDRCGLIG